jgi:UPF0271 protein
MTTQFQYTIDINADLGEGGNYDEDILALISTANIACGGHTGDEMSMTTAIKTAKRYGVKIGAHPSFVDRDNFGRSAMHPPLDELYQQLKKQIQDLTNIAHTENMQLNHVKPHGALYNQAAQDMAMAEVLVMVIKECDPSLSLMGLAQSPLIQYAQSQGVSTIEEAFSDRRYHLNGSLVSRQNPLGCITDVQQVTQQCITLVKHQTMVSIEGPTFILNAKSICVHGDGEHALRFIRQIRQQFLNELIAVKSFS